MIDSPPSSSFQAKGPGISATAGRPQRIYKRRDPKPAYHHNISRYLDHHSFPPDADFLNFQNPSSFIPVSSVAYTFPSNSSISPESAPVSPLPARPLPDSPNGFHFSSQAASAADVFASDSEAMSATESRVGSFDSLNSLNSSMAISIGTQASSISDEMMWQMVGSEFESPSMTFIEDLALPDKYFSHGLYDASYSPTQMDSPEQTATSPFDNYYMAGWPSSNNLYDTGRSHWAPGPLTHQQLIDGGQPLIPSELPLDPWTVEGLSRDHQPDAGCIAFAPDHGRPYKIFKVREEHLNTRMPPVVFGPEPPSPMIEEEDWEMVHSNAGSVMHGSPQSEGISWCQVDSSPQSSPSPRQVAGKSHMFSTQTHEPPVVKPPRGRQRALTTQEKKEAREVRKAKACWACHLSKIKCSPCSEGTPCQQCDRLDGKRRFCLMSCFNSPLEMLQTFVIPDYLTAHFQQSKIEEVISQNATSWGSYEMVIHMNWGYEKPLVATVVALTLPSQSRLAYSHQTSQTKEQTLVRKRSLPLGIPLASFHELRKDYEDMVNDIVRGGLEGYVPVPYEGQKSGLPESLLQIICSFYRAGLAAGQECQLLAGAISIHVISTMLERSLILDDDSHQRVEAHLREEYPPRTAPNCAQRQIKFALFLAQRKQVTKVLEDWGAMMWSSSRSVDTEKKWAKSFSVLLMLILVVDKMFETANFFCEGRIHNHGYDASSERRQLADLVRLTERELFERCKEIFHSSFKTRKGGKEACNPIRDGLETAFRGRSVPEGISRLVWDLQRALRDFGTEIRSSQNGGGGEEHGNAGRLAAVFLGDFGE